MRMARPSEALRGQLRNDTAHVPQCRLLNGGQLLIVGKQQSGHNVHSILGVQRFDRLPGTPRNVLVAVLLPASQIAGVQRFGLMIDGRLGEHRHPERYSALLFKASADAVAAAVVTTACAIVVNRIGRADTAVHLDIVHADQERFNAAAALLVALSNAIQVRVDQARQELQCEFAKTGVLDTSIKRTQLLAHGVQKLI